MRILFSILLIACYSTLTGQVTYIYCGQLFDAEQGTNKGNMTVVVKDDLIIEVEKGFTKGSDIDQVIDLSDKWVTPGWIDMHVHIESEGSKGSYINRFVKNPADYALDGAYYAGLTLRAGFTTVRDMGGTGANVALRNSINIGRTEGPRIYTARKALAISGGHADPSNGMRDNIMGHAGPHEGVCDSPEECAKAVRWQVKNGADWIKITATGGVLSLAKDGDGPAFSDIELASIIQTATDRGVHVAAHCHGKEGMMRSLNAGVKTIEHGTYADEEVFQLMKAKNAWLIPTITAGMSVADSAKISKYFPAIVQPKAERIGPQILEMFKMAYKNNTPIGFGTDAGVFTHGKNALEFGYMVQGGMPLLEAVQCATIINARILKEQDRIGSISPGKWADIVAVPLAALNDPSLMMNVAFVMKSGTIYLD